MEKKQKKIQWHPAFCSALRIEFAENRDRFPRKLFSEIKKAGFDYFKHGKGIYYVERLSLFKMQIIVSSELDEDAHLQLRALTDHMTDELFQKYLITMNKYPEWEKQLSDIVLQVIADSNMERIEEWKERDPSMCEAMKILMKDELDNQEKKGIETGKLQEIFSSVEEGDYSVERGAQKTGMLLSDFKNAMVMAGYKIPIEC